MESFFWNTLSAVTAAVIVSLSKSLLKKIKVLDLYKTATVSFFFGLCVGTILFVYATFANLSLWNSIFECACAFVCLLSSSVDFVMLVKYAKNTEKRFDQAIAYNRAKDIQ